MSERTSDWLERAIEKEGYTVLDWETALPMIAKRWTLNESEDCSMEHRSAWEGAITEPRKEFEKLAMQWIRECESRQEIEFVAVRILDDSEEPLPYTGWRVFCYMFYPPQKGAQEKGERRDAQPADKV